MDKKLQMLERLYESDGRPGYDGQSIEDATDIEAKEMRLMSEAKFVLDRRSALRPEPGTIDAIVRRAADGVGNTGGDENRSARVARIIPLQWRAAVAAVFVLFAVGMVYWQVTQVPTPIDGSGDLAAPSEAIADSDAPQADFRERRDAEALRSSPERSADADEADATFSPPVGGIAEMEPSLEPSLGSSLASSLSLAATNDSIPAWDDSADLRLVQKRIDMLRRSGGDLDWGSPAVPLEQLPASRATPGIRAAGASGNNN